MAHRPIFRLGIQRLYRAGFAVTTAGAGADCDLSGDLYRDASTATQHSKISRPDSDDEDGSSSDELDHCGGSGLFAGIGGRQRVYDLVDRTPRNYRPPQQQQQQEEEDEEEEEEDVVVDGGNGEQEHEANDDDDADDEQVGDFGEVEEEVAEQPAIFGVVAAESSDDAPAAATADESAAAGPAAAPVAAPQNYNGVAGARAAAAAHGAAAPNRGRARTSWAAVGFSAAVLTVAIAAAALFNRHQRRRS
jgi:hypothetical protein